MDQDESNNSINEEDNELSVDGACSEEHPVFAPIDLTNWSPLPGNAISYISLIPITNLQPHNSCRLLLSTVRRHHRNRCRRDGISSKVHQEKRLFRASSKNDIEAVVELLNHGVNPSCSDESQRTPLHIAASQGHVQVVKELLDKGANPNKRDCIGNTPLHLACCAGYISVVTLLLRSGTNVRSLDKHGRTPFTIAKSRLNFLMQAKSYSSGQVKSEALQLCDMMKTYLDISGCSKEVDELDSLCGQLQKVSTREDVDHVNSLLSDFASLNIAPK